MKVGDLVIVNEAHWRTPGKMGIIVRDLFDKGNAFKVLFSDGKMSSKLRKNLEVLSESR